MAPAVAGKEHRPWCIHPMFPKWIDVELLRVHFSPFVLQRTAPEATSETKSMEISPALPV